MAEGCSLCAGELEPVVAGQGATSFLAGSHKAHFSYGGPNKYAPNVGGSPFEGSIRNAMGNPHPPPPLQHNLQLRLPFASVARCLTRLS